MDTQVQQMPPALKAAVDRMYAAFRGRRAPDHLLDVCLNCCMDDRLEKQMRQLPLRQLTARHFYEYNTSAKSSEQPVDEVKYLLPRLIELIAQGQEVHHSTELFLTRLGRCSPDAFTDGEHAAIDGFALAFFAALLDGNIRADKGWPAFANAFDALLMFDIGGVALKPLLDSWLRNSHPSATAYFVCATYWNFLESREINMAFASDRPEFRETMKSWLQAEETRTQFTQRLMALESHHLDGHCCNGDMQSQYIIGAVFDAMVD